MPVASPSPSLAPGSSETPIRWVADNRAVGRFGRGKQEESVLSVYENGPSVKSIVGRNPLSGVFGLVASGQTPLEDPTGGLTIAEIPTGRSDDASRRGSRIAWEEATHI